MHVPELSLRACRFSRLGSKLGVRMYLRQWKMAIGELKKIPESLP